MKLLLHYQTAVEVWEVKLSHTLLGMWLLIHAKLIHVDKCATVMYLVENANVFLIFLRTASRAQEQ